MVAKDSTFKLVKSLTPSEKRYFQLFASITEGEKNYLLIFEEMEKMEVYNERIIKEKYKAKKLAKNLTFEKLYLQKMILKALRNYHGNDETSYVTHYADIEILIEKGLPELLDPLLKKYKQLTIDKEQWLEHLILTTYEYKNAGRRQDSAWFEKNMEQYAKNHAYTIEQLRITSYLKNTYNLMILIMRREKFNSHVRIQNMLNEIFNKQIYDEMKPNLNTHNAFYLNILYNTYLVMTGGLLPAIDLGKKELQRIYNNKHEFNAVGLQNYLLMANNHAKNLLTEGLFKEAIYHANKMYEILQLKDHKNKDLLVKANLMFWVEINIMALTLNGNFTAAQQFYTDNKKIILSLGNIGGREFKTLLDYYRALYEFGKGKYDVVLEIIGDIKETMQHVILSSESQLTPVLYIMAHLEKGNFQYLENFLRSTKRFYAKQHVELTSIALTHKIFGEYIKYKNTVSFKEKCKGWLKMIHEKSEEPYEHNFLRKTLVRQWLLSKYYNLPMEKITKDDAPYFRYQLKREDAVLLYD
ncbi:MAG: hypothetical protein H7Y00_14540 [Fimbriimonadaceae bacterium]|nr:hypothetical protein [Chitinophagales bacterium]